MMGDTFEEPPGRVAGMTSWEAERLLNSLKKVVGSAGFAEEARHRVQEAKAQQAAKRAAAKQERKPV